MEDRFNKKYNYPYVFLNEEPFTDEFKTYVILQWPTKSYLPNSYPSSRIQGLTDAKVEFGLIPKDEWTQPSWIDETRATAAREKMVKDNVIYGGMIHA